VGVFDVAVEGSFELQVRDEENQSFGEFEIK